MRFTHRLEEATSHRFHICRDAPTHYEDNQEHHSLFNLVVSSDNKTAIKIRTQFRLPAAEIKAYRLEVRPYRQYRVSGIPLYPNTITPVEQIRLLGGSFRGDHDLLGDRKRSESPADLDWSDAVDEQLKLIQECPSIRRVNVCGDSLTDQAAKTLAAVEHLQHIRLCGDAITSASLEHLGNSAADTMEILRG